MPMIKLLSILALLFPYILANGQISISTHTGLGLSSFSKVEVPLGRVTNKPILSYSLGANFDIEIYRTISLNGDFLFSQRGGERISNAKGEAPISRTIAYYYLSFPLYVEKKFSKFHLGLGAESALYVGGKFRYEKQKFYPITSRNALRPNTMRDFSLLGTLGIPVRKRIIFSLRYLHGLRPINRYPTHVINGEVLGGDHEYNRVFSCSLRYQLTSGR
jgi:hypothetical protein